MKHTFREEKKEIKHSQQEKGVYVCVHKSEVYNLMDIDRKPNKKSHDNQINIT